MGKPITMFSLFDGSGGFPLGGLLHGITPVGCSEIEPFPIRVTTKRLPQMKHYGDICKLNGADLPPVDIITFGSPCQNLSIAGLGAGLDGEKSSLFFEAVRIIKEMRRATNGKPRFIVWENVPGAYSRGKGEDYRRILDEIVKIKDEALSVPMPDGGKWLPAGEIRGCASALGEGFSIAWRTFDAQFWGVPQRRRRIYLVADFGGYGAGDVLFESEGLPWIITPGRSAGEGTAAGPEAGVGESGGERVTRSAGFCTNHSAQSRGIGFDAEISPTLRESVIPAAMVAIENHPADSRVDIDDSGTVQTLTGRMGTGGGNVPMVMNAPKVYGICSQGSNSMRSDNPYSGIYEAGTSRTIDRNGGDPRCNQGGMVVVEKSMCIQGNLIGREEKNGPNGRGVADEIAYTLNTIDRHAVAFDCRNHILNEEVSGTLQAKNNGGHSDNYINPIFANHTIRRLTPLECSRLQGFPDDWCAGLETPEPTDAEIDWWAEVFAEYRRINGRPGHRPENMYRPRKPIVKWLQNPYTDGAAYKMWGNGVALPCVSYIMAGIAEALKITD